MPEEKIHDPFAIMKTEVKKDDFNPNFLTLLDLISRVKKHRTTAPTHTPRNLLEQFEFFDDGSDRKLYIYINGVWRSAALT